MIQGFRERNEKDDDKTTGKARVHAERSTHAQSEIDRAVHMHSQRDRQIGADEK